VRYKTIVPERTLQRSNCQVILLRWDKHLLQEKNLMHKAKDLLDTDQQRKNRVSDDHLQRDNIIKQLKDKIRWKIVQIERLTRKSHYTFAVAK
jgi:hypothetical protein